MNRALDVSTRRLIVLMVIAALVAGACGSGTVEVGSSETSPPATATESSVTTARTDREQTRSVPFEVVAEDLDSGEPYSVAVIPGSDEFDSLGIADPGIDFSTHVVFVFDLAESSSPQCQFQPTLQLTYDDPHQVLYPLVLMEGQTTIDEAITCEGDANPHRIVLSVARDDLPPSHFSLWINGDDPPGCCTDHLVFVAEGELTRLDGEFPALDVEGNLADGETRILYGVSTHCGVDPISWVIDGSQWTAVDSSVMSGIDPMPAGWPRGPSQVIDLVLERTSEDRLIATALGTDVSIEYQRSTERFGCD